MFDVSFRNAKHIDSCERGGFLMGRTPHPSTPTTSRWVEQHKGKTLHRNRLDVMSVNHWVQPDIFFFYHCSCVILLNIPWFDYFWGTVVVIYYFTSCLGWGWKLQLWHWKHDSVAKLLNTHVHSCPNSRCHCLWLASEHRVRCPSIQYMKLQARSRPAAWLSASFSRRKL